MGQGKSSRAAKALWGMPLPGQGSLGNNLKSHRQENTESIARTEGQVQPRVVAAPCQGSPYTAGDSPKLRR